MPRRRLTTPPYPPPQSRGLSGAETGDGVMSRHAAPSTTPTGAKVRVIYGDGDTLHWQKAPHIRRWGHFALPKRPSYMAVRVRVKAGVQARLMAPITVFKGREDDGQEAHVHG